MLIDSNIIIYATQPAYTFLLSQLRELKVDLKTSVISKIEVLGYHKLKKREKQFLENFFNALQVILIDNEIVKKTIELKQERNIATSDAVIAATALIYNIPLLTQNKKDFSQIRGLKVLSMEDL